MKKTLIILIACMAVVIGAGLDGRADVLAPDLREIVQLLGPEDEVSVLVTLSDKVNPAIFRNLDKGTRRAALIRALQNKSEKTQHNVKNFLRENKAGKIHSFWIFNGLAVTARVSVIEKLARMEGIESIRPDVTLSMAEPVLESVSLPEWNIDAIKAPAMWNMSHTGTGTVLASMDTGVDYLHPDIGPKWRGGANSWYDPNGEHDTPYDANGHGTGVMGILVGGDAGGSVIGVAPGAQWIAVKMFNDAGKATYSSIHAGYQWLLDPDGNAETDDAPDVVNNSWGFSDRPGECLTEFEPDIQALKASGIGVVFSAGNGGPYDATSESPANYPTSFAAGAVDQTGTITYFSARGPSACDGGTYPQVVAPGASIRTADITFNGNYPESYATVAGTSFAAPHVAGAMALLLSADPSLGIDELEAALSLSALDLGEIGPDNVYGNGLLDVAGAYTLLSGSQPQCTDGDLDGFFAEADCGTVQDCNDAAADIYPGAPEIKHDGIDQDCNGYDLTIEIVMAEYSAHKDSLSVEATSGLGADAGLELAGYGAMKWNRKKETWGLSVRKAGGDPGIVTVSGIEGTTSALTGPAAAVAGKPQEKK
jgi:serine protease AprX